jgi:pyruvate kinase
MIALSFVRKGSDITYVRELLGPRGANIKLIAKIENQEGLENYDDILREVCVCMCALLLLVLMLVLCWCQC